MGWGLLGWLWKKDERPRTIPLIEANRLSNVSPYYPLQLAESSYQPQTKSSSARFVSHGCLAAGLGLESSGGRFLQIMGNSFGSSPSSTLPDFCISLFYIFVMGTLPKTPAAVHFTADWCAPSKYMAGFFENLSLQYPDILFLLVDVDEVKGVKDKMDVKAMPTFLLMKGGVQEDKIVGANVDELQKRVAAFAQMVRQSTEDKA